MSEDQIDLPTVARTSPNPLDRPLAPVAARPAKERHRRGNDGRRAWNFERGQAFLPRGCDEVRGAYPWDQVKDESVSTATCTDHGAFRASLVRSGKRTHRRAQRQGTAQSP